MKEEKFLENMNLYKEAMGWSWEYIALETNVSRNQIYNLRKGKARPGNISAKNFLAICEALNMDPNEYV